MAIARPTADQTALRWHFGRACFDGARLQLTVDGAEVELERRPKELLALLLAHGGEVVTKDEILDTVWAGRDVSDASLVQCVTRLRRALGEDGREAIRTVHGYGYRLDGTLRVETIGAPQVARAAGDLVAGWRLARRLGEGGTADVWLAEADDGAAKVLKFARDAAGIGPLKREVALGRLLAQALGTRGDILPIEAWNLHEPPLWVRIPWIAGGNLAAWLDARGGAAAVPLAVRIGLLVQVADALAAAHGAGVLHKDIKPGNVLIDDAAGAPRALLADFGSGAPLDLARLDALGLTRPAAEHEGGGKESGASGATRLYQAPEVAAGAAPGMAADIFALGVLLFQLIVGDFTRTLAPGWADAVADPLLRDDIALAGAGDPSRRMASAAMLATRLRALDTRRADRAAAEAAQARAMADRAALDRARARRAPIAALAGALVLGLVASTTLYIRAERASQRSARDAARAKAVSGFLIDDLFSAGNPVMGGNPNAPIRSVLDAARAQIDRRFPADDVLDRAAVQGAIGGAYAGLAQADRAMPLLQAAVAGYARSLGPGSDQAQQLRLVIADLAERVIDYPTMKAAGQAVLDAGTGDARTRLHARYAVQVAGWMAGTGSDVTAVAQLRVFLADLQRQLGTDDPLALRVADLLAYQLAEGQRFAEAIPLAQHTVAASLALYGPDNIHVQERRFHLAMVLNEAGQAEASAAMLADVRARLLALSGEETELSNRVATQLGRSQAAAGRYESAIPLLRGALDYNMRTHGPNFVFTRAGMNILAKALAEAGQAAAAIPLGERALALQRAAQGDDNEDTIWIEGNLAQEYRAAGRPADAVATLTDVVARCHRAFSHGEWDTGFFTMKLGEALQAAGRDGRPALADSVALLTATLGKDDARTQQARKLLLAAH